MNSTHDSSGASTPPERPAEEASHARHSLYRRSAQLWQHEPLRRVSADRMARGLGWFSIGLGLAELLAPRTVARLCGLSGRHTGLVRLYGLREIASGMLIFGRGTNPAAGVWSRVAGDAMDLAALSAAAAMPSTDKRALGIAAANVVGITALDVLCAQELSRQTGAMTDDGALRVLRSITVNRRPDEIYAFWRNLENLPRFMYHLQDVRVSGERTSHWVTTGPGNTTLEWDAEITADQPNELIAWRSLEGAQVENAGTVRFEPRAAGHDRARRNGVPSAGRYCGRRGRHAVQRIPAAAALRRSAPLEADPRNGRGGPLRRQPDGNGIRRAAPGPAERQGRRGLQRARRSNQPRSEVTQCVRTVGMASRM